MSCSLPTISTASLPGASAFFTFLRRAFWRLIASTSKSKRLCQLAGERIAALFAAVLHFPNSVKISHFTNETGLFLQLSLLITMKAAGRAS